MSDPVVDYGVVSGAPLTEKDLVIRRTFDGYGRPFDLYRCQVSGVVQTVPKPDLPEIVSKEYTDDYMAYQAKDAKAQGSSARRRLGWIERHIVQQEQPRILDVGCATGWFLQAAQNRGFDIAGVELSRYAARIAEETLGARIFVGSVEEADYESESFDVVHSNQVIEHVLDPMRFLRRQLDLLKPGGLLVVGTPNMDSLAWRRLGGNWASLQKPDHIVMFSESALRYVFRQFGIDVLAVHSTGMPPFRSNWTPTVTKNVNQANKAPDRKMSYGGRIKYAILRTRFLSNCASRLIDRLRLGDTVYVIGRKSMRYHR